MELSVVSDDGDVLRLKTAGRITQSDISPFSDELGVLLGPAGYARRVTLGLAETDFIDSSGINWLLVRHKRFREGDGKLVIHSVSPVVLQVLEMMRMDQVFHLAEDEPAALAMARGDDS